MKRIRKITVLTIAVIMVILMAVGCGSNDNTSMSASNNDNAQDEIQVEDTVEDVADVAAPDEDEIDVTVPDDETTPDENVADSEPELVEEDDPNIIDGIDFTSCNQKTGDNLDDAMYQQPIDSLRYVVMNPDGIVEDIIYDGDHFVETTISQNSDIFKYAYYLYGPKEILNLKTTCTDVKFVTYEAMDYETDFGMKHMDTRSHFSLNPDVQGTDIEVSVTVNYVDGTEDTITVYVTNE